MYTMYITYAFGNDNIIIKCIFSVVELDEMPSEEKRMKIMEIFVNNTNISMVERKSIASRFNTSTYRINRLYDLSKQYIQRYGKTHARE